MNCKVLIVVFVAVFAFATKSFSQTIDCAHARTQTDMNFCAQKEYEAADKELNVLYKSIIAKLTPSQKTILILSQRKWISYRDGYCKIYASVYEGGSIASGIISGCKTGTTRARISELKELYSQVSR